MGFQIFSLFEFLTNIRHRFNTSLWIHLFMWENRISVPFSISFLFGCNQTNMTCKRTTFPLETLKLLVSVYQTGSGNEGQLNLLVYLGTFCLQFCDTIDTEGKSNIKKNKLKKKKKKSRQILQ